MCLTRRFYREPSRLSGARAIRAIRILICKFNPPLGCCFGSSAGDFFVYIDVKLQDRFVHVYKTFQFGIFFLKRY